ncbi:hypothetical protein RDV89_08365 [Nocardioides zeae]|uniref:Uncharacterized protein n=1 Tax=Nocardioides imazamoxiresistens TaxID=3231893 RepID=A0ABU3PV22_9ACTN|nr:hypothetical protein [Nocardioides zeae]MDT9593078.1 hypothetical protein [Nocardioides zeae]
MPDYTHQHGPSLTLTWVKVVDASGRQRMEARWMPAAAAVVQQLAA